MTLAMARASDGGIPGIEEIAEEGLQGPADVPAEKPVEEASRPAEPQVDQGQDPQEGDEQGDDPAEQLEAVRSPANDGHDQVLVPRVVGLDVDAQRQRALRFGHDQLGHDDAGGRRNEGGGHEVPGDHRDVALEQEGV
jgi:hypothetical protein